MKKLQENFGLRTFMIVVFVLAVVFTNTVLSASPFVTKAYAQTQTAEQEFVYYSKIPLTEEQQKYMYDLCVGRGLDYINALATIQQESHFDPKIVNGSSYGLFQVNKVNHERLVQELGTANDPLNIKVNINWGVHILSELKQKYMEEGLEGEELQEAVLSAYNKGEYGYKKTGKAISYIKKHDEALNEILKMIEESK